MDILDELGNLDWAVVVAESDRVPCKTGLTNSAIALCVEMRTVRTYQFINQGDERLEVLLNGDVEVVLVLEVDGHCRVVSTRSYWDMYAGQIPFMMAPTSSIERRRPGFATPPSGA